MKHYLACAVLLGLTQAAFSALQVESEKIAEMPMEAKETLSASAVSSDGRHFLGFLKNQAGVGLFLAYDGKKISDSQNVGDLALNHDGSHFAYVDDLTPKQTPYHLAVMKDGKVIDTVSRLSNFRVPVFSPNDDRLVYYAIPMHEGFWHFYVDGKEAPNSRCTQHDVQTRNFEFGTTPYVFSADGAHLAYFSQPDEKTMEAWMVVDGKATEKGSGKGDFPVGNFAFDQSGNHFTYSTHQPDHDTVWLDGHALATCPGVANGPFISPDGKHVAYATTRKPLGSGATDNAVLLVVDGTETVITPPAGGSALGERPQSDNPNWLSVRNYFFKPDSSPGVYITGISTTSINRNWMTNYSQLVMGKNHSDTYNVIWGLSYAKDGKHYICAAMKQDFMEDEVVDSYVLTDGQPGPKCAFVDVPLYSPDGNHVAYGRVLDGAYQMVLDGKIIEGFQLVMNRNEQPLYVCGQDPGYKPPYCFDDNGWLRFVGVKDRSWYRIVVKP